MQRREFLGVMAAPTAAPGAVSAGPADGDELARPRETVRGEMRYRPLGRTGEEVSVLGLGGHHIGRQKEAKESVAILRAAVDAGITFMDNCWDYHDGGSEIRMGEALRDGYRKKVFLMTKIDGRTKKAAAEQLDQSLKRL
jgi:aryl-alcohol dehydrogenase-like predicted oxidoreductase